MKTLVIIRHAKSSWENPTLPDFERPLNERGLRDAPRMAKRLKEKDITPDLLLSSPANRALSTCNFFSEVLQLPSSIIKTDSALYHASEETLLKILTSQNDKHDVVFMFGHNPGLTDFVNKITDKHIVNIPTCGIVGITFDENQWKEITWGSGKVSLYDYPKNKV